MAEESMKTKGRNKFLLCFRPLVIDGALTSDGRLDTGDPVFAYIAVAEEGNLTILSPLSEKERSPVSEGKMAGRRHRKSARRIFSRMVKAVLLGTLSKKSVRDGKVGQDPYRYDSSLSTESENSYSSDEKSVSGWRVSDYEDRKINSTVSSSTTTKSSSGFSSSLISSSSISSSSSLNACPWPMPESKISRSLQNNRSVESKQSNFKDPPQKTNKTATARCYSFNFGLFLLLISFSVMIFWGRVCAILCTSTWFYFVVRRVSDDEPPESVINSPEIDTKEYEKRVIMEGLLERGHRL